MMKGFAMERGREAFPAGRGRAFTAMAPIRSVIAFISLCVFLHGCVPANVQYLQEGTGRRTAQDVAEKWGGPSERQLNDSGELWVYRFQRFDSLEHPIGCEGYKLQFDERQILRQWGQFDC